MAHPLKGLDLPTHAALLAAVLLVLAVPAFWPDYLARLRAADPYTHAHALLGTLWLLALMVQPLLIRARRLRLHRLIGRLAGTAGLAFFTSGVLLTHYRAGRMTEAAFERDGSGFYLPLVMSAIFGAALLLGLVWRREMAVHARFMACTSLALVDPVLARLLHFYAPPLPAAFLYQLPAFAIIIGSLLLLQRGLPPASPGGRSFRVFAVGVTADLLLYFLTPYSATWLDVLRWFRALPLT
jgi:hypothetical protein